ncbi:barstar family protein [Burkholderia sp. BCC1972]|uniref:barstar family protein n=1 Tax=Burkholderia sp. BCC1972 TaxID=2817438 RepID=UPI002ABE2AC8|nr:barstar family protein [Burkholderia sp. BCC1972]
MLDKLGICVIDAIEARGIVEECRRSGWLVIVLPEKIASKNQFFDAIRDNCPLDPPLQSNRSWDALADSLWSGFDAVDNERIVIFWPDSDRMAAAEPDAYVIATDIFEDLCVLLADSNVAVSRAKILLVFKIKN